MANRRQQKEVAIQASMDNEKLLVKVNSKKITNPLNTQRSKNTDSAVGVNNDYNRDKELKIYRKYELLLQQYKGVWDELRRIER